MLDVGSGTHEASQAGRDEAVGGGSSNLNWWLLPPELPTNGQSCLPQRPDSEGGDLSAERREGEEKRLSGQSVGGEGSLQTARDRGTAAGVSVDHPWPGGVAG